MVIYNFDIRAGNTGTVKNETGLELIVKSGTPPAADDLTGDEFVLTVRMSPLSSLLLRKTSDDGGIILTPLEGRVLIPFSVDDTRRLWVGRPGAREIKLTYEVERRKASTGGQRTILSGDITVIAGGNDD